MAVPRDDTHVIRRFASDRPWQLRAPGGVSNYFTVSGEVTNKAVFDLSKLEQFSPAG
jgi:hypothetical protein